MAASHEVYQRDDGLRQIGVDGAGPGPFESRNFALQIASGHKPAPLAATQRFRISEVRRDASA